jgi:RNA polymerase sigma-70 factor (ECF subfamily)
MNAEEEFERMYRACYPAVLAYARRRTTPDAAEDAAAQTFLVAWRKFRNVPAEPLPWLYGVARRVLADQLRSTRRRRSLLDRLRGLPAPAMPPVERHGFGDVLGRLGEADREALMLTYWEGLDGRAAATALGCSEAAFRVRLHRARKRLEAELARESADALVGDTR